MSSMIDLALRRERRENLPRYGDEFVGRRLAMERVSGIFDTQPAATLVGPPGVGKSRLGIEFAWMFLDGRSAASAWFCDLTGAADEAEVLAAIGRPLGLQFGATAEADAVRERIGRVLASLGTTLLIVDNAERHPELVARCVQRWVRAAEHARVLVTSRRPVGELPSLDVRPLRSDDAVALLEDRLRRVRPDVRLDESARGELLSLAADLDGLPLALEVVAPQMRLLSPGQLRERLDLAGGPLEAALRRSWDLLESVEQRAFAQTAVFRGGFDVPAAEAVLEADGDRSVVELLNALVDHSLLRPRSTAEFPDETRLGSPLPVVEFAREKLEQSGDLAKTQARHVEYFVEHGEAWDDGIDSGDELENTRRLVVELPNLLAAWEQADGEDRVRLGLVLHMALQRGGPFTRQFDVTEDTVERARRLGVDRWLGRALLCRARAQRWRNDFEASLTDLEEALQCSRRADDLRTEASTLRNLAAGSWGRGDLDKTREYADEALRVSLESGNPVEEINSRNGLGFLFAHTGAPEKAQEQLERALALARELERAPGLLALVSSSLSALMAMQGRFEQAVYHSTRALELYRELDYVRSVPHELIARAEALCASGDVDAARADVEQARRIIDRMGFRSLLLRTHQVATLVELLDGEIIAALGEITRATQAVGEEGDRMLLLGARLYEVVARSLLGELPQAEEAREAADELIGEAGPGRWDNLAAIADGFLSLARAERASEDQRADHLAVARQAVEGTYEQDAVASSLVELLADALPDQKPEYRIARDGRAFGTPGEEPVDITRRKALRGILKLLVQLRDESPGTPATLDDILEAGWPGEVMTHDSGKRRVYVSVKRLRDLGLEGLLVTSGDGYLLDPNVPVELVDAI